MPDLIQGATRIVIQYPFGTDIDPRIVSDISKSTTHEHVTASANGNNTVHTTASGKQYKLKSFFIFNSGAAAITVYLRDGAAGSALYQATLAANTGFGFNLIGCNMLLAASDDLVINLSAGGTVDVTISGEEI